MQRLSNDARICKRCGTETLDQAARCARCGGRVASARTLRVLGWTQVGLGSFLVLFMGTITYYVARIIYQTNAPATGARFTGSPEMALYIFGIFGLVLIFGVACIASGAWQAHYARPNRKLMFIILGLGVLFIVIGTATRFITH
jgi:predicted membrane channel-forming protein YqfA (hemolysin III family)